MQNDSCHTSADLLFLLSINRRQAHVIPSKAVLVSGIRMSNPDSMLSCLGASWCAGKKREVC